MTFTIDTGTLQSIGSFFNPIVLLGIGAMILIMMLAFKFAEWGDKVNGRPAANTKGDKVFIIALIILAAIASVGLCGQSTGHTTLITAPGQAQMWG